MSFTIEPTIDISRFWNLLEIESNFLDDENSILPMIITIGSDSFPLAFMVNTFTSKTIDDLPLSIDGHRRLTFLGSDLELRVHQANGSKLTIQVYDNKEYEITSDILDNFLYNLPNSISEIKGSILSLRNVTDKLVVDTVKVTNNCFERGWFNEAGKKKEYYKIITFGNIYSVPIISPTESVDLIERLSVDTEMYLDENVREILVAPKDEGIEVEFLVSDLPNLLCKPTDYQ